jgi:hypothetical protein
MVLEPGQQSISPSSGRASPAPRKLRNQPEDDFKGDKVYKRYASGVDRSLSLFETAFQDWADYISFLSRLMKVSNT